MLLCYFGRIHCPNKWCFSIYIEFSFRAYLPIATIACNAQLCMLHVLVPFVTIYSEWQPTHLADDGVLRLSTWQRTNVPTHWAQPHRKHALKQPWWCDWAFNIESDHLIKLSVFLGSPSHVWSVTSTQRNEVFFLQVDVFQTAEHWRWTLAGMQASPLNKLKMIQLLLAVWFSKVKPEV